MVKNTAPHWYGGMVCAAMAAWMMCLSIAAAQESPPPLPSADKIPMRFPVPKFPAEAPQPSADPRNFEGGWHGDRLIGKFGADMFNERIPFNEQGQKVIDRRIKAQQSGTPYSNASAECRPVGFVWQLMADPLNIHQTDNWIEINTYHQHGRIFIYLDPKKAVTGSQYEGVSVGRWDGDTLVVETTKFKRDLWLDEDGTPASKNAKLTTRIRKVRTGDRIYLEAIHTLDDPKHYTRPWSWLMAYYWRPDKAKVAEYNCEEQMGDRDANRNAGLIPEPQD